MLTRRGQRETENGWQSTFWQEALKIWSRSNTTWNGQIRLVPNTRKLLHSPNDGADWCWMRSSLPFLPLQHNSVGESYQSLHYKSFLHRSSRVLSEKCIFICFLFSSALIWSLTLLIVGRSPSCSSVVLLSPLWAAQSCWSVSCNHRLMTDYLTNAKWL